MDNNTSAPPSKVGRIMQALGEQAYYRSPILGQAMEVADVFRRPDHANDPKESRLGNIKRFVVDSAVQRSPILNKMAQMYDFAKSLGSEEPIPAPAAGGGAPAPTTSPSTAPGVNPAGGVQEPISAVVEKLLSSSDNKGVVDYFNDKENIYYKSLEESRTNLEKIMGLLKSQFELMEKSFKIQEETNEREKTVAGLTSVGRGELLPNALAMPPDMAQMDNTAGTDGEAEKQGWLDWLKDNAAELVLGGGAGLVAVKSLWGKAKGAVGSVARGVKGVAVGAAKGAAKVFKLPAVVNAVQSIGSKMPAVARLASKVPAIGGLTGLASKATNFLGPVAKILGPLSAATVGLDIYDFGKQAIDKSEALRNQYPELRGLNLGLAQEQYLTENPDMLKQAVDEAKRNGSYARNMRNWEDGQRNTTTRGRPNITPVIPSPVTPIVPQPSNADEVQQYPKGLQGSAAMNNQNILDIINKTNVTAKTTQTPATPQQPPMIVGGPTNVNNNSGGNVTNIYNTGRDSLSMPQLAFNLPSTVY